MWSQVHAQAAKLGLRVRNYRDENGEDMLKARNQTAATGGRRKEGLYDHIHVLIMYMGIRLILIYIYIHIICVCVPLVQTYALSIDLIGRSTWNRS